MKSWVEHFASLLFPKVVLTHLGRDKMTVILQTIFSYAFSWIKISLKFVPKGAIKYIPALVQIMAWLRSSDEPLSEPVMVSWLTHICVIRPQWVNRCYLEQNISSPPDGQWRCCVRLMYIDLPPIPLGHPPSKLKWNQVKFVTDLFVILVHIRWDKVSSKFENGYSTSFDVRTTVEN